MPFAMRYARQFAARRRTSAPEEDMNRLYVVETMVSPTGAVADHRLRRKPVIRKAVVVLLLARLDVVAG